MKRLGEFKKELRKLADREKASILARFFKTGKGEYGYGDKFLGVTVPQQRAVAREFLDLRLADLGKLLDSAWHEERLGALIILVKQYGMPRCPDWRRGAGSPCGRAADERRAEIFKFYLAHTARINNWDLVDLSAPNIVGDYLWRLEEDGAPRCPDWRRGASRCATRSGLSEGQGSRYARGAWAVLNKLARSRSLWERRIALLATFTFIRSGRFNETLKLAEKFLNDSEPLIHKATGWMLREIGKRDVSILREFLKRHGREMPRVALRYAIERLEEGERRGYLNKI